MPHHVRLLHVASFDGNIGDNASHNGFYRTLTQHTGWTLDVTPREIRKTYLRYDGPDRWRWDEQFIAQVNAHDLTVVGGGNYFELWVESSVSGTTVDLDPSLLAHLQRPLVFHGIGCDPCKGHSAQTLARFERFLKAVLDHPLCLVAVRNDGSWQHIRDLFGDALAQRVLRTPDPGFFVDTEGAPLPLNLDGQRYWAVNLAVDMPEIRFPGGACLDYPGFIQAMRELAVTSLARWGDLQWVLVPHIYSDLRAINDLLEALPDHVRRQRVSVAPCLHGKGAEQRMFRVYEMAELAMGTRFHTNVCAVGLGTPSLGLVTYQKLADLYAELNMPERALWANRADVNARVMPMIEQSITSAATLRDQYAEVRARLLIQAADVHHRIRQRVESV
ncbi:MAG: polysaccharide pyruvyl transferase family protein [Gammaproteobacteria bacterium]|nr:polysaccharide pyruvyl transferase family protein [Gammaproteobacteria bacterium]